MLAGHASYKRHVGATRKKLHAGIFIDEFDFSELLPGVFPALTSAEVIIFRACCVIKFLNYRTVFW